MPYLPAWVFSCIGISVGVGGEEYEICYEVASIRSYVYLFYNQPDESLVTSLLATRQRCNLRPLVNMARKRNYRFRDHHFSHIHDMEYQIWLWSNSVTLDKPDFCLVPHNLVIYLTFWRVTLITFGQVRPDTKIR